QVVLLLFLVGWFVTPLQAAVTTLVQTSAGPEIRGRVASLLTSSISTATVLSMAFAGVAGQLVGVRNVFLLCGGVIAGGAVIALALFRRDRQAATGAVPPAPPTPTVAAPASR